MYSKTSTKWTPRQERVKPLFGKWYFIYNVWLLLKGLYFSTTGPPKIKLQWMGGNDCTWTPLLYWLHTIFRGWRRQKWMSQILHPTSGNIVLGPMRMPHTTNPVPLPAYPFRGFSRWVSHQYFWVSENMRKNPLCKKTKNKMIMDWREDQFCQQLSTLSPLPLLGQTITISELGNQYFSLMLPHNACKGDAVASEKSA